MFISTKSRLLASGLFLLIAGASRQKESNSPAPYPAHSSADATTAVSSQIAAWVTKADKSSLFARQNVAYKTPAGKKALIVLNTASRAISFNIKYKGKIASPQLASGAVGTYVW